MALAIGTRLHEFELLNVIGEGGFSIVYLAYDHSLQRTVAIKEYLPGAIAIRDAQGLIRPRFEKYEATFNTGRQSFLNEARILAQFEHPALIRIHRFWEQNGTAYMVMQYCAGKTLRKLLLDEPERQCDEQWLKLQVIDPVLDALQLLHSKHYYHRDLSPDNIIVLESGMPMLLDFGAARQVIGDMTQALTVILKPGFAPIEQYADDESMRQGPWTDIYGVGAVMYFAVTGKAPVASVARLVKDPLPKLSQAEQRSISAAFAQTIDHALAVFPNDRPQSIDELRRALLQTSGAASHATLAARTEAPVSTARSDASADAMKAAELGASAETVAPPRPQPDIDARETMLEPASPVQPQAQTIPSAPEAAQGEREAAREPLTRGAGHRLRLPLIAGVSLLLLIGAALSWWISPAPSPSAQVVNTSLESVHPVEISDSPDDARQATLEQEDGRLDAPHIRLEPSLSELAPVSLDSTMSSDPSSSVADASPRLPPATPPAHAQVPSAVPDSTLAPEPIVPTPARAAPPAVVPAIEEGAAADQKKPGAYLRFSVQPWGRIVIDGQEKGISPPLTRIWLPEGPHQVVIENGDLPKHTTSIHISNKQDAVLSHKF